MEKTHVFQLNQLKQWNKSKCSRVINRNKILIKQQISIFHSKSKLLIHLKLFINQQISYIFDNASGLQSQFYMIEIAFTLFLLFSVSLLYLFWFRPKRLIKNYVKQIRDMGYTVLQIPYNPFTNDLVSAIRKGISQGDAIIDFKNRRCNYDVVVGNALFNPRIQINHPDFIKSYYAVDKHFEYPKAKRVVELFSRIAGRGLAFSQGQEWKRKRSIFNKVFNFDFIKSKTNKIASICSDTIKDLQSSAKRYPDQNLVQYDILDLTVRMFSGVMMELFLGCSKQERINNEPAGEFIKKLLTDITQQNFQPLNLIFGPPYSKLGITPQQRYINNNIFIYRKWGIAFVKKRISQIEANLKIDPNKTPEDIIEALILARKNTPKYENIQESITSQKEIFEQFSAFLGAGTDTTSNYAQMMIYMIACHPNVEAKIRQEIEKYVRQEDYSYDNLKNLKYIDNFQKEVTRCYGPGTQLFSRSAQQDNYLNGLPVKKGTRLTVMAISNHYNEKYFKDPKQFRPQRWENQCNNIPNFVFGGFSGGARTCIGKHLALIESKVAVIKFLKRYKRIVLPKNQFKMIFKFLYSPQNFLTKMEVDSTTKL